ncbi:UDP-2,3-diacylglucosamine diphosphatase [Rhodoferax sp.]|uniref:UDP-2,3-diacylglucosamine diphosphatase n=1 Tax=Rhodoferax sp. TaxID=50421 RepID=UPI002752F826|nr:UDP-2,3-diacylglucosamine diphosphatase [Rhodoferax sp.]
MSGLDGAVSPHSAPVLLAPADWRVIDFISDVHLNACEPATMQAWQHYMQSTRADAVFVLGDLFDVWVGDDLLSRSPDNASAPLAFEQLCAQTMRAASQRLALYVMHGNRDFLIGKAFATACGATLIADPTLLQFAGERYLLSHGDALCLDDTDYMQFRAMVRGDAWQAAFLEQPLAQRRAMGKNLRAQSEERKRRSNEYFDLRAAAVDEWLLANHSSILIHGHTHRAAVHDLGTGRRRVVLSDWDALAAPRRTEILRLQREPAQFKASVSLQRIEAARAHLT